MNNEEKIISMIESLSNTVNDLNEKVNGITSNVKELKNNVSEIMTVQRLHTHKLDAINNAINYQIEHSTNLSDRVRGIEHSVLKL